MTRWGFPPFFRLQLIRLCAPAAPVRGFAILKKKRARKPSNKYNVKTRSWFKFITSLQRRPIQVAENAAANKRRQTEFPCFLPLHLVNDPSHLSFFSTSQFLRTSDWLDLVGIGIIHRVPVSGGIRVEADPVAQANKFKSISDPETSFFTMGKKGKRAQAGKPQKLSPKEVGKRLDALVKKLEEELEGADLFAPLPPTEDCAICFVPLSHVNANSRFLSCCGKNICIGCNGDRGSVIDDDKFNIDCVVKRLVQGPPCPFCRTLGPKDDVEQLHRLEARALKGDPDAFFSMGTVFHDGYGVPKDTLRGIYCWIRAIELGCTKSSCNNIAVSYDTGRGLSHNKERALLFERAGVLRGDINARFNLAVSEYQTLGNHEIGIRHWKIAAEGGCQRSLTVLRDIYEGKLEFGKEFVSKEYLSRVYRICHAAQMKVKSEMREMYVQDEYGQRC